MGDRKTLFLGRSFVCIEAGLLPTYAKVMGPGPGSGGNSEEQFRLEMGVPSAIRTATERTTPVRMSVRLRISKVR